MFKNNKIYNQNLIIKSENLSFLKKNSFSIMQKAARLCSKFILKNYKPKNVVVLCGPGNNGGDGLLIANNLLKKNIKVEIFAPIGFAKSKDSKKAYYKLKNNKIIKNKLNLINCDLFVDALFGFNFNKKFSIKLKKIVNEINSKSFPKIAIDVPSGVYCDTGKISNFAIQADITLAFHRLKPCHVLQPGKDLSKKVKILDIGLANLDDETKINLIRPQKIKALSSNKHKYSRGELFIFGGNEMIGASKIATLAASQIALRTGTGIVKLLVNKKNINFYKSHALEELIISYSNINDIKKIIKKTNSTFLFGCGLEINTENSKILELLLKSKNKLVIDASSFSLIKKNLKKFFSLLKFRRAETILTPHFGEFKRIFKNSENKIKDTISAASLTNSTILFKGNDTVISNQTGKTYINYFSSPYLATAGSGDVLAGIIASLLAQKYKALNAGVLGCWLHSQAAIKINKNFTAKDIIDILPKILKKFS